MSGDDNGVASYEQVLRGTREWMRVFPPELEEHIEKMWARGLSDEPCTPAELEALALEYDGPALSLDELKVVGRVLVGLADRMARVSAMMAVATRNDPGVCNAGIPVQVTATMMTEAASGMTSALRSWWNRQAPEGDA